MTEIVKIRGDSRELFLAAQRFSKEALQQSTNWSPEILWQGMEDRFHKARQLWRGKRSLNRPHASFLNSLAEQKMDCFLNTGLILNAIPSREKNAPFIVSFFFQLFMCSMWRISWFCLPWKTFYFIFTLGGEAGKARGRARGGRETHVPKSRRAAYCNKMECNKSYRTPECIDSLKIHID